MAAQKELEAAIDEKKDELKELVRKLTEMKGGDGYDSEETVVKPAESLESEETVVKAAEPLQKRARFQLDSNPDAAASSEW